MNNIFAINTVYFCAGAVIAVGCVYVILTVISRVAFNQQAIWETIRANDVLTSEAQSAARQDVNNALADVNKAYAGLLVMINGTTNRILSDLKSVPVETAKLIQQRQKPPATDTTATTFNPTPIRSRTELEAWIDLMQFTLPPTVKIASQDGDKRVFYPHKPTTNCEDKAYVYLRRADAVNAERVTFLLDGWLTRGEVNAKLAMAAEKLVTSVPSAKGASL